MSFNLPKPNEVVPVNKTSDVVDIKPAIERALQDAEVVAKVNPYVTNGGLEGHKLFDNFAAMAEVMRFDDGHGATIRAAKLNAAERNGQFVVVLRRHFMLDKKGKAIGLNPKRYRLLEAPAA